MEVNDLQSARDLNLHVELTNIDLCANFYLPSFTRDFSIPKIKDTAELHIFTYRDLIRDIDSLG